MRWLLKGPGVSTRSRPGDLTLPATELLRDRCGDRGETKGRPSEAKRREGCRVTGLSEHINPRDYCRAPCSTGSLMVQPGTSLTLSTVHSLPLNEETRVTGGSGRYGSVQV